MWGVLCGSLGLNIFVSMSRNKKELPSQEYLMSVFGYRDGELYRLVDGGVVGTLGLRGYLVVWVLGDLYFVHRLVWVLLRGKIEGDFDVDHINRVRSDNRIENLRLATRNQNNANTTRPRKNKHDGCVGVEWDGERKRFRAVIMVNGKRKRVGRFQTAREAHEKYKEMAKELFGEFCPF